MELTLQERLKIPRTWDGGFAWNPKDIAKAQLQKAKWGVREFVRGYCETGAPIEDLVQQMDLLLEIVPWER